MACSSTDMSERMRPGPDSDLVPVSGRRRARLAGGWLMAGLAWLGAAGGLRAQGDSSGASVAATATASGSGEQTYREICAACHMANAEGAKGAASFPALAANAHLADRDFVLARLVHGQGGMPAFAGMLSPEEIAAVAHYVRTHFGNHYADPVTVADVQRVAGE